MRFIYRYVYPTQVFLFVKEVFSLQGMGRQINEPGPFSLHFTLQLPLLLDLRSIDISASAQEKEGHFHCKNFLRASKWGIPCHTCSIIPKSLYCELGLSTIHSIGVLRLSSRYGMWYLISKLSKSFYNESHLLFLVHHRCLLTLDLRVVNKPRNISTTSFWWRPSIVVMYLQLAKKLQE